jgi:hypothetical protein
VALPEQPWQHNRTTRDQQIYVLTLL